MKLCGDIVKMKVHPKAFHGKIGDPNVPATDFEMRFVIKVVMPRKEFEQTHFDPLMEFYLRKTLPVTLIIQTLENKAAVPTKRGKKAEK